MAEVLNSSPRAPPPLCIFCMSLFVNTPDSDNQLVRSALHAWNVFRLTYSLHRVYCSLLPEQGKSTEGYFISEHSFMDLRCAMSSRTDECDIIYLCKYIQFEFTSCTLQCTLNGIYTFASNWNHGGISCDVHFAGHLRSNRTNIWSDKSNIRNMQSERGARTGIENHWSMVTELLDSIIIIIILFEKHIILLHQRGHMFIHVLVLPTLSSLFPWCGLIWN